MKQHSKTRQLKVLSAVRDGLNVSSFICNDIRRYEINEGLGATLPENVLQAYGLWKYRPKSIGGTCAAWWGTKLYGYRRRLAVLNKRIKELSKKK